MYSQLATALRHQVKATQNTNDDNDEAHNITLPAHEPLARICVKVPHQQSHILLELTPPIQEVRKALPDTITQHQTSSDTNQTSTITRLLDTVNQAHASFDRISFLSHINKVLVLYQYLF